MAEPADFVVITNAFVDPRGPDVARGSGEYVVIANVGPEAAGVGGWRLRDRAGAEFVVPEGRTIGPRGRLEVHSGPGRDDERRVYAGRRRAMLNNPGDTIELLDAAGRRRQRFTYRGRA